MNMATQPVRKCFGKFIHKNLTNLCKCKTDDSIGRAMLYNRTKIQGSSRSVYTCVNTYIKQDYKADLNHQANTKSFNVGIFGAGRVASTVHIPNILKNRRLNVKWMADDNAKQVEDVRNKLHMHNIPCFTSKDREGLLSDKSLDAVFIFTPTETHADYICSSLQKGKSVMCEKPTGESYTEIKTCYETAENNGKVLLTGYMRRFDPVFEKMYEAAHNGSLGDLQVIKLTTRDSPKPSYEFLKNADPSGCNIISDLAVHDIDLSVWLTGSQEPESVYVVTHCHDEFLQKIGQPDTLAMLLKFKNGIITSMDVSRDSAYGYDIRIEMFGSKGMATAENPRRVTSVIDVCDGGKMTPYHHSFPQRFEKAFENEITHFVDCLDGKTTPLITKSQCLIVAEIIEKAVQSYKEKRPIYF